MSQRDATVKQGPVPQKPSSQRDEEDSQVDAGAGEDFFTNTYDPAKFDATFTGDPNTDAANEDFQFEQSPHEPFTSQFLQKL